MAKVDPVVAIAQSFKDQSPVLNAEFIPVTEAAIQLENLTNRSSKQSEFSVPPSYTASQRSDSVSIMPAPTSDHALAGSQLVNPEIAESGFSAQQLSPLELKFNASSEEATGVFNGYETERRNHSTKTKQVTRTTLSSGMGPSYGTLPLIGRILISETYRIW